MKFMNKKEEVLDIQLTSYGKKLLSEGTFEPVYYAFVDDNILYDPLYASMTGSQNSIHDRIVDDTPQLGTQHKFTSKFELIGDIEITEANGTIKKIPVSQISQRDALVSLLGTSELNSQKYPAFSLKVYDGEITNIDTTYTSSMGRTIPQIDCKVTAHATVRNLANVQEYRNPFNSISSGFANDQTYIALEVPQFFIELQERNVEFDAENFDIEVFMSSSDGSLVPLNIKQRAPNSNIKNGILLDEMDVAEDATLPTNTDVEYYFDVIRDDNISPRVLNAAAAHFKSSGFYNDAPMGNNISGQTLQIADIYSTTVSPEDIEDCD